MAVKSERDAGRMQTADNEKEERSRGGGQEGGRVRKGWRRQTMGERIEEGETANKRGHWRQIKDTQLNDWMDGPLELNGHLHPAIAGRRPPPPATGQPEMSAPGLGSSASRQPPVCTGARTHNQSHRYKSICFTLLQRCVSLPRLFQRLRTTGEGGEGGWRGRNKGKLTLEMETARGSLIKRKLLDNGLLKYARSFLLLLPLKINK